MQILHKQMGLQRDKPTGIQSNYQRTGHYHQQKQ